jgi:GntR family transcriptional regulator
MSWNDEELTAGPVPLWFQIADRLRTAVEKGEFAPGDRLPPESALERRFGVSRTTARAAMEQLAHDGLITRKSGKGSIVQPLRVDQPLNLLASFSEDMRARGLQPGYRTLQVKRTAATPDVASELGVDRGERVACIKRLLLADGSPLATSTSWLPPWVTSTSGLPTTDRLDSGSLYEWLDVECGARIAAGTEFIEAANADAAVAALLEIGKASPVLRAARTAKTADGRAVEYAVLHYRADRYRFRVDMVRP